ncbi:hypothetical protein ACF0H5_004302 [Mactra antiquata]
MMLRMGFNGLHIIVCVTITCLVMDVRSELTLQAVYSTVNERLGDLVLQTFSLKSSIENIKTRLDNIEESISKSGQLNENSCKHEITDSKEIDNSKFIVLKAFESEKMLIRRVLKDYDDNLGNTSAVLNGQMKQIKEHMDNSINRVDIKIKKYETRANESIDQFRKDSDAQIQIVSKQLKTLEDKSGEDQRKSLREIRQIQGSVNRLAGNMNNLSDRTDGIEGSINLLKDKPRIGFTAYLSQIHNDVPAMTTLVFDRWTYNYENVYNIYTGIFTAPKTGLYLFYFNVRSCKNGESHAVLMVNDSIKNSALASTGTHSSGSAAIAHMTVGDKAFVRTSTIGISYCFNRFRTSFTGVLIS